MFRDIYLQPPAQAASVSSSSTFKDFPPRQRTASFSLNQVLAE
ncbi:hypothetical protein [Variovorax sp. dw_308]|nr:hypothetical protein [Variovorax sp. dw_308]